MMAFRPAVLSPITAKFVNLFSLFAVMLLSVYVTKMKTVLGALIPLLTSVHGQSRNAVCKLVKHQLQ